MTVGQLFRPTDRFVYEWPGAVAATGRRAGRVTRRLFREGRLRASR